MEPFADGFLPGCGCWVTGAGMVGFDEGWCAGDFTCQVGSLSWLIWFWGQWDLKSAFVSVKVACNHWVQMFVKHNCFGWRHECGASMEGAVPELSGTSAVTRD